MAIWFVGGIAGNLFEEQKGIKTKYSEPVDLKPYLSICDGLHDILWWETSCRLLDKWCDGVIYRSLDIVSALQKTVKNVLGEQALIFLLLMYSAVVSKVTIDIWFKLVLTQAV